MFGSELNTITLSLYAILPAVIILFYVYKRDYFPEPPRLVFITLLLGASTSFPTMLLIPFFEGYLETLNFGVESNHFYMSFIRAAFIEEAPLVSDWPQMTTAEHLIVLPYLIGGGLHAQEDIPIMLGISAGNYDKAPVTGALSAHG